MPLLLRLAIAARQSRAIRCRSGAINARRKDFTGCRAFWASAGLRVHSATCARPDRTLPDGSANPPGPWRSGIAVIDTGARTTRHNKRRQRRLRSRATRQPGGSCGDGTAQPCSDPDCRSGGFTQGQAVMTRPSLRQARITGPILIRDLRLLCQEKSERRPPARPS